ncbi:MAG: hypothetical protein ACI4NJ_10980 [Cellvibrio sp.]
MKKLASLLLVLAVSNGALANNDEQPNLTLAAADIKSNAVWVESLEDAQLRIDGELAEKAEALNAEISEKLQQQIERKVTQELNL